MILPWAQLQPAMKTLLKRLSSTPVTNQPDPSQGVATILERQEAIKLPSNVQQMNIDFAIISDVGYGDIELRTHYDPSIPYPGDTYAGPGAPLGSIVAETNQNRLITFQVNVEGGLNAGAAREVAQAINTRLSLPSALDDLRAMGLALVDWGDVHGPVPSLDPNYTAVPVYVFDFVCGYMSYALDAYQTTIETADIDVTVDT